MGHEMVAIASNTQQDRTYLIVMRYTIYEYNTINVNVNANENKHVSVY